MTPEGDRSGAGDLRKIDQHDGRRYFRRFGAGHEEAVYAAHPRFMARNTL